MDRSLSPARPLLVVAVLSALFGAGTLAAQPPELAPVTLTFEAGATPCITVEPESVTVFVTANPRGVEWTVAGKDPGHLWLIEYAPEKEGASAEHFGARFRIPCGTVDSVKSGAATRPGTWPYSVSVFECPESGSPPPGAEPLCRVDPEVVIKETPGG